GLWLYPSYRCHAEDSSERALSLQHFTDNLLDLLQNQLQLPGIHHTRDQYGSMVHGVRFRVSDDEAPSLEDVATTLMKEMRDEKASMRAETRVDEQDEGDEGVFQLPPTTRTSLHAENAAGATQRCQGGIGGRSGETPSSPSSPSSARHNGLAD